MNNIELLKQQIMPLAGLVEDPSWSGNWMSWMNLIIGLLFCVGCGILLWVYFMNRSRWSSELPEYDKYSTGTFKGFWERYRSAIVLFLAVVLLIVGVAFIMGAITGYMGNGYHNAFE